MMFGLGVDATTMPTPATQTAAPGFIDGVKLWMTPSAAISALSAVATSPSTSFSSAAMPFSLGILAVPLGIVAVVMSMGGGKHR